jgi:hypothetical protein
MEERKHPAERFDLGSIRLRFSAPGALPGQASFLPSFSNVPLITPDPMGGDESTHGNATGINSFSFLPENCR